MTIAYPRSYPQAACCPQCGQVMVIKFGVKFPPTQALMVEMIDKVTKGRGSVSIDELISMFYPGESRPKASQRVRSHIHQINELLIETEYKVKGVGGIAKRGRYKLIQEAA